MAEYVKLMARADGLMAEAGEVVRKTALAVQNLASLTTHATGKAVPQMAISRYGDEFAAEDASSLAIGSLTGIRYWTATSPWHLTTGEAAVSLRGAKGEWHPGENVAVCANSYAVTKYRVSRPHAFAEIPSAECGCGFWAYWAPSPSAYGVTRPQVAGMIEGWGGYRAGTKGFRCSKAKILALCVLERAFPDEAERVTVEGVLKDAYQVPVYGTEEILLKAHPPSRKPAKPAPPFPGDAVLLYSQGGRLPRVGFSYTWRPADRTFQVQCACGTQWVIAEGSMLQCSCGMCHWPQLPQPASPAGLLKSLEQKKAP